MKLLILDRDGVINEDSDAFIKSAEEWVPIPGSIEAVAKLSRQYRVYIATNQSGIGRGLFDESQLEAMHDKLNRLVEVEGGQIEAIYYCPHLPEDNCQCRKPRPGLLTQIGAHAGSSLESVPVVGDSLRDLEAAIAVGAKPVLVMTGKGSNTYTMLKSTNSTLLETIDCYPSLAEFADSLLDPNGHRGGEPLC